MTETTNETYSTVFLMRDLTKTLVDLKTQPIFFAARSRHELAKGGSSRRGKGRSWDLDLRPSGLKLKKSKIKVLAIFYFIRKLLGCDKFIKFETIFWPLRGQNMGKIPISGVPDWGRKQSSRPWRGFCSPFWDYWRGPTPEKSQ